MRSIIVYETIDGQKFIEKELAERHEGSLQDVRAYEVQCGQEIGGKHRLQKAGYLVVHAKEYHDMFAEYWGYGRYGNRVKFDDGKYASDSIKESWKLTKCKIDDVIFEEIIERLEEDGIVKIWKKTGEE